MRYAMVYYNCPCDVRVEAEDFGPTPKKREPELGVAVDLVVLNSKGTINVLEGTHLL